MEDRFLKIEAYINGLLPDEEAIAFRAEIEQNQELEREVKLHQLEWEAMHFLREQELRSKFQEWRKGTSNNLVSENEDDSVIPLYTEQKKSNKRWLSYGIAASVLLFLGLGGLWGVKTNQYSPDALFENKYNPNRISNSRTKSPGNATTLFDTGYILLENKKYTEAIEKFREIPSDNSLYEPAQLFIGHTYFQKAQATGDSLLFEAAIQQYQQVASTARNRNWKSDAEWYELMSLFLSDRVDERFRIRLTQITNDPNHNYQNEAASLLKDLDSIWYKWSL